MRRTAVFGLVLGFLIVLQAGVTRAIVLDFVPAPQTVNLGSPVAVGLRISGLGGGAAPSVGVFDLDVSFDPGILSFTKAVYGDPVLGDQLDLFGLGSINATTPGFGTVNLFELSLDLPEDLELLQAGAFTLATLSFST